MSPSAGIVLPALKSQNNHGEYRQMMNAEEFADHAAATLLWSELVHGGEDAPVWHRVHDGQGLDRFFDLDDLIVCEGWGRFVEVCKDFLLQAGEYIEREGNATGQTFEQAAHDFILTANGHGAGFWDGDWKIHGEALTAISRPHGPIHLDVGDDGDIYFSEV